MIHLYCGDGKGKTTCAFGLALRAAGRGREVVVAQFLKGADTGERLALAHVSHVRLLEIPQRVKFSFALSDEERREETARQTALLEETAELLETGRCDLAVLDECCAAVGEGLLPLEKVTGLLDRWGREREMVLTGRDPHPALLERADYVTEMRALRHPYERGVAAREGIEY